MWIVRTRRGDRWSAPAVAYRGCTTFLSTWCLLAAGLVVTSRVAHAGSARVDGQEPSAEDWREARPNWQVGQSWEVRLWACQDYVNKDGKRVIIPRAGQTRARFLVKAIVDVGEHKCFEVQYEFPRSSQGIQRRFLLYYRCDNYALVRYHDVTLRADGTQVPCRPRDTRVNSDTPVLLPYCGGSLVPLDWPVFSKVTTSTEKTEDGRLGMPGPTIRKDSQEVVTRTIKEEGKPEYNVYEVTLTRTRWPESDLQKAVVEYKTTQQWSKGLPWWRKASWPISGGKLMRELELIIDEAKP